MKLLKSLSYAWNGFKTAFAEQPNLRIHVVVALVVIALGFYFNVTSIEWSILLILIGIVLAAELFNTALENLTDLVTKEYHPLAGKAKDIAAAAVLVLSVVSLIVGFIIFAKYV
jgi:undecaprenol kinase